MANAAIELKNITKTFGSVVANKNVSLTVNRGEILSVLGENGSGKTTLMNMISGIYFPDDGQIFVDGKCIFDAESTKRLTSKEIRERQLNFGMVFQQFNLFPQYSALENVMLAPKLMAQERPDFKERKKEIYAEIEENAKGLLQRVGLGEKLGNYPCELSGGQQQRVSIARALALKPRVLFFDEPTSALDPELTGEILRVIKDLAAKNITMVIVTHEIEFAKNVADRIIFMDGGVVLEDGTPEEVIDNPKNERTKEFLSKML